jgi:hypothetical protein
VNHVESAPINGIGFGKWLVSAHALTGPPQKQHPPPTNPGRLCNSATLINANNVYAKVVGGLHLKHGDASGNDGNRYAMAA